MRKNVWKRFLAATLAAVVMFTSVDCTGLVVNATEDATTKSLNEIIADHNGVNEKFQEFLCSDIFMNSHSTYTFVVPDAKDLDIELKVDEKRIVVSESYEDTEGIIWEPSSATISFAEGEPEVVDTLVGGEFKYTSDKEVTSVKITYNAYVDVSVDDQAEFLNAPYYMYHGAETASSVIGDGISEYAEIIRDSIEPIKTAISGYETLKGMVEDAPELELDALGNQIEVLDEYFVLNEICAEYETYDSNYLFWVENANDLAANFEQTTDTIAELSGSETLSKLGELLGAVGTNPAYAAMLESLGVPTGDEIAEYQNAYDDYVVYLEDFDLDYLFESKTWLMDENFNGEARYTSAIKNNMGPFGASEISGSKILVYTTSEDDSVSVQVNECVVTVYVSANIVNVPTETKSFKLKAVKGQTTLEMLLADAKEGIKEKLAEIDPEGEYGLYNSNMNVYAEGNYEPAIDSSNITDGLVKGSTSISIEYSPAVFTVTCTENNKTVELVENSHAPYGYAFSLPAATADGMVYVYRDSAGNEFLQGTDYVVKGAVEFTRTLKKGLKVNDVILERTDLTTETRTIFANTAVKSDVIITKLPESNIVTSDGSTGYTVVTVPDYTDDNGYTWTPNKVRVKYEDNLEPVVVIEEIVDNTVTIPEGYLFDHVDVEYALVVATGDNAKNQANVAYDLVRNVQSQLHDLNSLAEESRLSMISPLLLSAVAGFMKEDESETAIENILEGGFVDGTLIIKKHVDSYKGLTSEEKINYYYDNYEDIKAQIKLLADNMAVIASDSGLDDMLGNPEFSSFYDAIESLKEYAGNGGALSNMAANQFEARHASLLEKTTPGYDSLITTLVSTTEDKVTKFNNLDKLVTVTVLKNIAVEQPKVFAKRTVTVSVVCENSDGEPVANEKGTVQFDERGLTVKHIREIKALIEELESKIDTEHYKLRETANTDKIVEGYADSFAVTYTWEPKEYTVTLEGETGALKTQTFPYDDQKIKLVRPESGYIYTYVINGEEYQVKHIAGYEYEEYSLTTEEFSGLFPKGSLTATITRTQGYAPENFIDITVKVKIRDGNGDDVPGKEAVDAVSFNKLVGLTQDDLYAVEAVKARLSEKVGVDTEHYVVTADKTLSLGGKTAETVTYTWSPKTYTVTLEGETGELKTQTFPYDNKVIKLAPPTKEGYQYNYDIMGQIESVTYQANNEPKVYTLTEEQFNALFVTDTTAVITRTEVYEQKTVTLNVIVKSSNDKEIIESYQDSYTFDVRGLTKDGVETIKKKIEDLEAMVMDPVHYECTGSENADKIVEGYADNLVVTYTWEPKMYTVHLDGETGKYKTQTFPYDNRKVKYVRPDEAHSYTYDVGGHNVGPINYKAGEEYTEVSLSEIFFKDLFGDSNSATIYRTETVKDVVVYVNVIVDGSLEAPTSPKTGEVKFKATGLNSDGVDAVLAKRAELTNIDSRFYDCIETYNENDEKVTPELKKSTTVTYTWVPKEFTLILKDEPNDSEYKTQKFWYDNQEIKLVLPTEEGVRYRYDIGKDLDYKEGAVYTDYKLKADEFASLFSETVQLAKISRVKLNAKVEDKIDDVLGDEGIVNTLNGYQALTGVKEVIPYVDEKTGNPEFLVVKIEDDDSETEAVGVTKSIASTIGALLVAYPYVEIGGKVVAEFANNKPQIYLQNAIDAILESDFSTDKMSEMYKDGSYLTEENVVKTLKNEGVVKAGERPATFLARLFGGRSSEKLGAEILTLVIKVGDNKTEAVDMKYIFSLLDTSADDADKKMRAYLKKLSNYIEVAGGNGKLNFNVKKPLSKELYELYLMPMILEGATDLESVNDVTLTQIALHEKDRLIDEFNGTVTIQTIENTLDKVGDTIELEKDPTVKNAVNKLIDLHRNKGYEGVDGAALRFYHNTDINDPNVDAEETFFKAEAKTTSLIGKLTALDIPSTYVDMIEQNVVDSEKNGYLNVGVRVSLDGIDADDDTVADKDYAAIIINDPSALMGINDANSTSAGIVKDAIELVREDELVNGEVPKNAMVIMLEGVSNNSTISFAGNGILDLNGNTVGSVVGKDNNSTVVLVDSTYENSGSAVSGKNVKDARQNGDFYKIAKDGKNLIVKFNGEALANALETNTTELTTLAVEVAFDLIMNNITSGDMLIDEYALYDIDVTGVTDDIFALIEDNKTDIINDVIDLVNLGKVDGDPKNVETEGLFGFINDILDSLTSEDAIDNIAACANNGNPIVTYTVKTNPVNVNLAVSGADYITAGIRTEKSKGSKEYTISLVVDQDSNKKPLVDLCNELADVVTESNINVDLDNIQFANKGITAEGASVNATLHVDLLRGKAKAVNKEAGKTEAAGNHDYAAIIAMVAANAEKNPANSSLKKAVEAYLADGSIDLLRKEVENITTAQLIKAVKNANGKTFAEIAAKLQLQGNADSAKNLAEVYDDLFMVVYKLASFVSNKLGIDGDNSKLGSLLKKSTEKVGDVTFTYYSYGGDVEGSREVSGAFSGFGAKAEGSVFADLRLTLFAEDDYQSPGGSGDPDPTPTPGGNQGGSGSSSGNNGPVEVHPAPTTPTTPAGSTGTATGDANNMTLWISVMGLAIIAVVAAAATKKRKVK